MPDQPPETARAPVPPRTEADWIQQIPEARGGKNAADPEPVDLPPGGNTSSRDNDLAEQSVSAPKRDITAREEQEIEDLKHNRGLRERYAKNAHRLAIACLVGWGLMLLTTGLMNAYRGQALWSDTIIIAVTTGVTVSVLAAFLGVIRGLFPNEPAKK